MWNEITWPSFLNQNLTDGELDRPLAREEFEELWRTVERKVRSIARMMLGKTERSPQTDAVDDMVQDTAVALLQAIELGHIRASTFVVKSWLWRTEFNLAMARSRTNRRGQLSSLTAKEDEEARLEARFPVAPSAEGAVEARGILRRMLAAVAPGDAAIFEAWAKGSEPREIARLLRLNPNTVRVKLHRARFAAQRAVRGELNARGEPEEGYILNQNLRWFSRKFLTFGQGALTKLRDCGIVFSTFKVLVRSRDASRRRLRIGRIPRKMFSAGLRRGDLQVQHCAVTSVTPRDDWCDNVQH